LVTAIPLQTNLPSTQPPCANEFIPAPKPKSDKLATNLRSQAG